jgi:polyhydroxybutyrate depolymerase
MVGNSLPVPAHRVEMSDQPKGLSPELLPVVSDIQSNFSQAALDELSPVLVGVKSAKKTGNHIELERDGVGSLPMQGDFLNRNVQVKSLNFGDNISFDYDENKHTITNLQGVSLSLSFFNSEQTAAVRNAYFTQDDGHRVLNAEFENPMPASAQRIFGMPNVVNVKIPVNDGGFATPSISQVFADAAHTTGPSIAGLLASDALSEASKVALFAESNPKWIGQVVDPALRQIYDKLLVQRAEPGDANQAPPTAVHIDGAPQQHDRFPPTIGADVGAFTPKNQAGGKIDVTKPGDYDFNTSFDGQDRHYKVHVPPNYDGTKPMPLVLLLHGHSQDGNEISRLTKLNKVADREGFIAVYPDATYPAGRKEWRAWDTDNGLMGPNAHADDVGFLRNIIDTAEKNYKVDPKRIYMGGLSNGGMMSFRAAGELSDKLAAIAVVSGAMSGVEPPLKHPLSVLNMHGTEDEIIPYEGLKNVPASLNAIGLPKFEPMDYATNYWAEQNGIKGKPVVTTHGAVTERRFTNATNGVEVDEYTIRGGRHVPDDIDGTVSEIWKFFKAHPKADGPVSGTKQPKPEEPLNIVERLREHVKTRGVQGLEMDTGDMLNEVENIGDGSFSPAKTMNTFESKTGLHLDDGVSKFLKATDNITMTGHHIKFDLQAPQQIIIEQGAGAAKLRSVDFDNPSFDLVKENGRPWLKNVEGVKFDVNAAGRDLSIKVKEVGQKLDGSGAPYYEMRADNPLPGWAQTALFAKSQVPIEMRLNQSGVPQVMNEKEIKDAMLGRNPVTRGWMDVGTDVYGMYNEPSWKGGLHLLKDAAIIGGTGYGAYRLAALKFATKGRIGVVAATVGLLAPSIIHGVESLID